MAQLHTRAQRGGNRQAPPLLCTGRQFQQKQGSRILYCKSSESNEIVGWHGPNGTRHSPDGGLVRTPTRAEVPEDGAICGDGVEEVVECCAKRSRRRMSGQVRRCCAH